MRNLLFKALLGAGYVSLAVVGSAHAGGFSRGSADTDIIFEDGNFNMRSGVTYVSPSRKYTVNPLNPGLVGVDYADSYAIPSAAVKFKIAEDLSCAGTLTKSYGGNATWPTPSGTLGKLDEDFSIYEYAATCGYKVDLSKGRLWFLGGVYDEHTDYRLVAGAGAITVKLKDDNVGWRAGIAYEIPEIALRAQLMYRSGVSIDASGTADTFLRTNPPTPITLPASGDATFPQSVELKLQSGIAPGWLAYGGVKWTDWSVTQSLNLHVPLAGIESGNLYFWKDGWTVTGGIGHAFNDWVSGTVFASYDSGVSTGYDLTAETYTVGAGASFKDKMGGELRLGGAVSRLGSISETKYSLALPQNNPLFGANRSVGNDWAYALSAGYAIKW